MNRFKRPGLGRDYPRGLNPTGKEALTPQASVATTRSRILVLKLRRPSRYERGTLGVRGSERGSKKSMAVQLAGPSLNE